MPKLSPPFTLLRSSFNIFKANKQLFYPFILLVFINLLALEILYFSPQYPLSVFFAPIVSHIWGEVYAHYPMDLLLLPKTFYYAQLCIYLFIGSFLLGVTAHMVAGINNEETVNLKKSLRKCSSSYIHIVLSAILSLALFQGLNSAYGLVFQRALKIHSTSGIYFWIKKLVVLGVPYMQLIFSVFITALLIYMAPIIVLEQKKIFKALFGNFKFLFASFWLTLVLVLVPNLLYVPVLLLRDNMVFLGSLTVPGIQVWVIALSILVSTAINIFIITAVTINYLFIKENP